MLRHWLQTEAVPPLDSTTFALHQYGARLTTIDVDQPQWTVGSIALLGWGDVAAYGTARDAFARLTNAHPEVPVLDLGMVQPDLLPLTELLDELIQQGVFPIVLASQAAVVEAQLRAQERRQDRLNLTLVDAALPYLGGSDGSQGLLEHLWQRPHLLGHTICLGSQAYLLDPQAVAALEERYGELHRLGSLRHRLDTVEPLVRQADVVAFGINAVRAADAPAQAYKNPNGWTAEEACQIIRYASMNDQLSSLCIYGLDGTQADDGQTAALIGQLVWFAIAGHQARLQELPLDLKSLLAYVVDNKGLDMAITFYKSPRSDRWWFKIPLALSPEGTLVACSYRDYQLACEGELADRLLLAIQRLT